MNYYHHKSNHRYSIWIFAISLVWFLACAFFGYLPRSSGSFSALLPSNSPQLSDYVEQQGLFGNYLIDTIAVSIPDSITSDNRVELLDFQEELEGLEGVRQVISPLAESRDAGDPVFRLISEDKNYGRFLVFIDSSLGDKERESLFLELKDISSKYAVLDPSQSGPFFISESVTQVVGAEARSRGLYALISLLLFATLIFRSFLLAVIALIPPLLSVAWTLTIASMFGVSLDPVMQLLPPFLLAVATAYSAHVTSRLLSSESEQDDVPAVNILGELAVSTSLAAISTIFGIGSLFLMDVAGVQNFALFGSMGVMLAFVFSMIIIPEFLSTNYFINRVGGQNKFSEFRLSKKCQAFICLLFCGLAIMISIGIKFAEFDTDPVTFLGESSPAYKSIMRSREAFPADKVVSITFKRVDGIPLDRSDFSFVQELGSAILENDKVFGVTEDSMFRDASIRRSNFLGEETLSYAFGPEAVTTADKSATRIIVETKLEGKDLLRLETELNQAIKLAIKNVTPNINVYYSVSGIELLLAHQNRNIAEGIFKSFGFTILVALVLLVTSLRSLKTALCSLVPNVLPVLMVYGAVGWLYGAINIGSALVAAAALSLALDNTFHFLIRWKYIKPRFPKISEFELLEKCRNDCLPMFLTSTSLLVCGFAAMCFSEVLPVRQFGILLILTLLSGVVADTFLLPFLLLIVGKMSR